MIIELEEDLVIKLDNKRVVLEKGDRLEVLEGLADQKKYKDCIDKIKSLLDTCISMTSSTPGANSDLKAISKKLDSLSNVYLK